MVSARVNVHGHYKNQRGKLDPEAKAESKRRWWEARTRAEVAIASRELELGADEGEARPPILDSASDGCVAVTFAAAEDVQDIFCSLAGKIPPSLCGAMLRMFCDRLPATRCLEAMVFDDIPAALALAANTMSTYQRPYQGEGDLGTPSDCAILPAAVSIIVGRGRSQHRTLLREDSGLNGGGSATSISKASRNVWFWARQQQGGELIIARDQLGSDAGPRYIVEDGANVLCYAVEKTYSVLSPAADTASRQQPQFCEATGESGGRQPPGNLPPRPATSPRYGRLLEMIASHEQTALLAVLRHGQRYVPLVFVKTITDGDGTFHAGFHLIEYVSVMVLDPLRRQPVQPRRRRGASGSEPLEAVACQVVLALECDVDLYNTAVDVATDELWGRPAEDGGEQPRCTLWIDSVRRCSDLLVAAQAAVATGNAKGYVEAAVHLHNAGLAYDVMATLLSLHELAGAGSSSSLPFKFLWLRPSIRPFKHEGWQLADTHTSGVASLLGVFLLATEAGHLDGVRRCCDVYSLLFVDGLKAYADEYAQSLAGSYERWYPPAIASGPLTVAGKTVLPRPNAKQLPGSAVGVIRLLGEHTEMPLLTGDSRPFVLAYEMLTLLHYHAIVAFLTTFGPRDTSGVFEQTRPPPPPTLSFERNRRRHSTGSTLTSLGAARVSSGWQRVTGSGRRAARQRSLSVSAAATRPQQEGSAPDDATFSSDLARAMEISLQTSYANVPTFTVHGVEEALLKIRRNLDQFDGFCMRPILETVLSLDETTKTDWDSTQPQPERQLLAPYVAYFVQQLRYFESTPETCLSRFVVSSDGYTAVAAGGDAHDTAHMFVRRLFEYMYRTTEEVARDGYARPPNLLDIFDVKDAPVNFRVLVLHGQSHYRTVTILGEEGPDGVMRATLRVWDSQGVTAAAAVKYAHVAAVVTLAAAVSAAHAVCPALYSTATARDNELPIVDAETDARVRTATLDDTTAAKAFWEEVFDDQLASDIALGNSYSWQSVDTDSVAHGQPDRVQEVTSAIDRIKAKVSSVYDYVCNSNFLGDARTRTVVLESVPPDAAAEAALQYQPSGTAICSACAPLAAAVASSLILNARGDEGRRTTAARVHSGDFKLCPLLPVDCFHEFWDSALSIAARCSQAGMSARLVQGGIAGDGNAEAMANVS